MNPTGNLIPLTVQRTATTYDIAITWGRTQLQLPRDPATKRPTREIMNAVSEDTLAVASTIYLAVAGREDVVLVAEEQIATIVAAVHRGCKP